MSEEQSISYEESKLINERIDVKAATIISLHTGVTVINEGSIEGIEASGEMELVYITNAGFVTGKLVNIDDAANIDNATKNFNSYLFASSVKSRNTSIADEESKNENLKLISDTATIYLKNATLRSFAAPNNVINFGDLLLFADQILGVSMKVVDQGNA